MASISVNTNRKEIEIIRDGENVGVIYFSPSDVAIIARLEEAGERINAIEMQATAESTPEEIAAEMRRLDGIVREAVDYAFGYPVSNVVFGDSFTFSTADGVSTVEQFLDGAMGYISEALKEENGKAKARQAKYTAKYKK